MKKVGIAALAAAGLLLGGAPSAMGVGPAQAADYPAGPCERQRELFETYNVQMDMHIPYQREICAITG